MAILIASLIKEIRGLLEEDKPEFWNDTLHLLPAINAGIRYAYRRTYDVTEWAFLDYSDEMSPATSISITQGNVDSKKRSYDLPAGAIYVSDYYDPDFVDGAGNALDMRPRFVVGSDEVILNNFHDYIIAIPQIRLHVAPTKVGTLKFYYKTMPAEVVDLSGKISLRNGSDLPDVYFDAIREYAVFYAKRRQGPEGEMGIDPGNMLAAELDEVRGELRSFQGKARRFYSKWGT